MLITEIYPAVQGEGIKSGLPSIFVRLAACNLNCAWCDSKFTWMYSEGQVELVKNIAKKIGDRTRNDIKVYDQHKEVKKISSEEVRREILKYPHIKNIVLTGGEPMLQAQGLMPLLRLMQGHKFEIETNGTINMFKHRNVSYNISPKMENSGNDKSKTKLADFPKDTSWLKFVVREPKDMNEIEQIIKETEMPNERVFLMPEGTTTEEIQERSGWIMKICQNKGYRFSTRQHIIAYGNVRGV